MNLFNLGISSQFINTVCNLLQLTSFTYCNVFKIHLFCSIWQYFIPFYCQVLAHGMYRLHFTYLFFHWWIFLIWIVFTDVLAVTNNASIKIWIEVLMQMMYFSHRSGIAGRKVIMCLPFSGTKWLFFNPFASPPEIYDF